MDERIAKLQELLKDENKVEALLANETPEDAQAFLAGNGIEYSLEEVRAIGKTIGRVIEGEFTSEQLDRMMNGELSEEELEDVAGGFLVESTITAGAIIASVAVGGGATGFGIYEAIKNRKTIMAATASAITVVSNFFSRW